MLRTAEQIVLQHRAPWSHHGDTWGLPGGARDSLESAIDAAVREAAEEAGIDGADVLVTGVHVVDHGGWAYATVLAEPVAPVEPASTSVESIEVCWHRIADVADLPLHPGFAASWPVLAPMWPAPVVVVDVANVVGSRPDGWWSDRVGATRRLYDDVSRWASAGLPADRVPGAGPASCLPRVCFVIEGAARDAPLRTDPRIEVVRAAGSGDDAIVDAVRRTPKAVVVTADRQLRDRVSALGAIVYGPRWLLGELGR